MIKKWMVVMAAMPLAAMAGDKGGVEVLNFDVGASYSDSRSGEAADVSAAVNAPVYKKLGATLSAGASWFSGKDNFIDSESRSASVGLFLRDYEIGRLGVSAGLGKTEFDEEFNVDDIESHRHSLSGEYYLRRLTLAGNRARTEVDGRGHFDTWGASLNWYAKDDIRLGVSGSGMAARDHYGCHIAVQPAFLKQSTQVTLSYSGGPESDVVSVGLNYYFETRVSLLDRDRKYR